MPKHASGQTSTTSSATAGKHRPGLEGSNQRLLAAAIAVAKEKGYGTR